MSARVMPTLAGRLAVAGRVILAALGGYGVAALATGFLALVLPGPKAEAVSAATLLSFAIMAAAAIWVFAARTLTTAALALSVVAAVLTAALWLAGGLNGGAAA
ncbi:MULTISPECIES: iron transporter [Methylobacterium]|jgi:hypothetical protein|uniref:Iron transporter n=1 Tax=Methylobacterium longum TaxID=767694 RepID=A0ABT8AID8_9HYPH|nr:MULTISPECIES: iron transporter [Methylobacterium]MCJ2100922.1 iron transporter [Methylobacterium sp. E-046]MDN3569144.1 iron transporter [Methylobacterium longum]GJE10554.1 hypothetical protein FOHLNKBM_1589 [Methylobacterium longum]